MIGKKKTIGSLLVSIIFIIGFLICIYPLVSSLITSYYERDVLSTYKKAINNTSKEALEEEYLKAEEYNKVLYSAENTTVKSDFFSLLSEDNYNSILNSGNGIMGSIEIPKIDVNLPIYHGTSDGVLSIGIGHIFGSSFPVGGSSTRSVLTGHRGLPNAKLFTRLDELENEDLFFIRVNNNILAYKVFDIKVIEPEEVDTLKIEEGKDLVSLVTCTPYGINTHRLVVTGERVPYVKEEHDSIEVKTMSYRELVFASIPFIFLGGVIVYKIKNRKNIMRYLKLLRTKEGINEAK